MLNKDCQVNLKFDHSYPIILMACSFSACIQRGSAMIKFLTYLTIGLLVLIPTKPMAEDYIIYSITQDFPMGIDNEVLSKNFFINMGKRQGVRPGNELLVFRSISQLDPYGTKKRFNHLVEVGSLKVIHTEDSSSICIANKSNDKNEAVFDIKSFMIGDKVEIKTD